MTIFDGNAAFRWAIRHETIYRYSTSVAFAPHVLRLSPRADGVRTLARNLHISPAPIELIDFSDDFGNTCTRVTFGPGAADELRIESRVEVQTFARPAHSQALGLPPLPWASLGVDALASFRQSDGSAEVAALARELAFEVHARRSRSSNACARLSIRGSIAKSVWRVRRRRPRKHWRWAAARVEI